jgi:predicted aldo/keto reductase-like oxidoreductase
VNYAKACLRYVINSGLDIDSTLGGMYYPFHVNENVDAFFNPALKEEEKAVLSKIRRNVKHITHRWLPEHYRFLETWAPDSWDDSDLYPMA